MFLVTFIQPVRKNNFSHESTSRWTLSPNVKCIGSVVNQIEYFFINFCEYLNTKSTMIYMNIFSPKNDKNAYFFQDTVAKMSYMEGNVHLVPKATAYLFCLIISLLSNKAEYKNIFWLRANLSSKIQITCAICGQGAMFRTCIVSETNISFFILKF